MMRPGASTRFFCQCMRVHFRCMHCVQAGGGVQLCPDAQVDDGKLDVTYILNPNLEDVPKILTGLQSAQLTVTLSSARFCLSLRPQALRL